MAAPIHDDEPIGRMSDAEMLRAYQVIGGEGSEFGRLFAEIQLRGLDL